MTKYTAIIQNFITKESLSDGKPKYRVRSFHPY